MKALDDAVSCPITLSLFRDPVVAQDGHTYERAAIEEWIRKNGTSPFTNKQISLEHLVPNYAIKKIVEQFENSLKNKNFQYVLDVDVKKKKGRPLFQTFGKTIYSAEWLPANEGRPEIILLKIDGARANKEASFYVDLSRHTNIVRTFGIVNDEDSNQNSIMLLQEYAPEGSLYEVLTERKKPLSEEILIEIFLQVIDAMAYLALNGVVHGDLACRNVLVFRLDENDPRNVVVKVTDFGISRYSKIYSQTRTVARTTLNVIPTRYCAPEVLSTAVTAKDFTEKSDVYSMGVLMWEAYSRGVVPWGSVANDEEVVRRVRNGDMLPKPENCSQQYWNILTKTWSTQPNERPKFDQLKQLFHKQMYQSTVSASVSTLPRYHSQVGVNKDISTGSSANHHRVANNDPNQGTSTATKKQTATGEKFRHSDMLEKVVRLGNSSYKIRAYVPCGGKQLFALESEKPVRGYDGICPACGTQHMNLGDSRCVYVSVDSVYQVLEQKKLEEERLQGRKTIDRLESVEDNLPPLKLPILGQNKGIEGDSNSCYMDATIFCMFAYSNVFDSLLNVETEKKPLKQLQKLLRENIVHVLRSKIGFVERDALYHLRTQLSKATGDSTFKDVEKDPTEFLRALERLFNFAPLKTIAPDQPPNATASNITTNIMWEMFDANPNNLLSTNIASIFLNSLSEIPAKLATIPPFLILVAPRHTRSERSYRYIIPDRQIALDNRIVQLVCLKCQLTNHNPDRANDFYSCDSCFARESPSLITPDTDAKIVCYCSTCLSDLHRDLGKELINHNPRRIPVEKHKLNLFAVLCIEVAHYVAFVKCQKQHDQYEWLFFDSMSDRIHNEKNIPLVDRVPDFEKWIEIARKDKYFFPDLDDFRKQARPSSQKFSENDMRRLRLFRDGAFFFYENSSVNYQ
ncbi:unnamed protein product [Rotaria socialis]|uniref:Uncharacterized protein n=3 Tax=Rotaria socialis TaxID=392032 RepID=A0A818NYA3_9BILA|nr:unnamed protein product [Rotaria socialis]